LETYFKVKRALIKHDGIQPSEIEKMPYYEYEMFVEMLEEELKRKKEHEERQSEQQSTSAVNPSGEASRLMKQAQTSMPKIQIPKF
jgi:hypothetical protein